MLHPNLCIYLGHIGKLFYLVLWPFYLILLQLPHSLSTAWHGTQVATPFFCCHVTRCVCASWLPKGGVNRPPHEGRPCSTPWNVTHSVQVKEWSLYGTRHQDVSELRELVETWQSSECCQKICCSLPQTVELELTLWYLPWKSQSCACVIVNTKVLWQHMQLSTCRHS